MTDAPRQCQWCYGLVYGDGPCRQAMPLPQQIAAYDWD